MENTVRSVRMLLCAFKDGHGNRQIIHATRWRIIIRFELTDISLIFSFRSRQRASHLVVRHLARRAAKPF